MTFSAPDIDGFQGVFQAQSFAQVPDDWWVGLADIEKSTDRVLRGGEEGWKTVNFVAAACIAAVENACAPEKPITIFTGDGALLAGPPSIQAQARQALAQVCGWAKSAHGLSLRVGIVAAGRLAAAGKRLEIACEQRARCQLHHARGGAADMLDQWLKADTSLHIPADDRLPDLSGLTCRFDPVLPKNDHYAAVIVMAQPGKEQDRVLQQADQVIRQTVANPRTIEPVQLTSNLWRSRKRLQREAGYRKGAGAWLAVLANALMVWVWQKMKLAITRPDGTTLTPDIMLEEVADASDYQRAFDGTRYLLDVTTAEYHQLRDKLQAQEQEGSIIFGVSTHHHSRLTCLVSADVTRHVHFIDGSDGGFWLAAGDLKRKLAALRSAQ